MAQHRPSIPAALVRQLFIEAGYKCSIPACGVTAPLEIDHIEDWSSVAEHRHENLIVLCANHHGAKTKGGPRALTATALRTIKANQVEMNGRYGDIERRVLDHFVRNPDARRVHLPGDFDLLLSRLLEADFLSWDTNGNGNVAFAVPQETESRLDADGETRLDDMGDGPYTDHTGTAGSFENDDEIGLHIVMRRAYALTPAGVAYVAAVREARALASI